MKAPQQYVVVDVANDCVVANSDTFLGARARQRTLQRSTSRTYRIDLADHRR